jgi:hypothetical protein
MGFITNSDRRLFTTTVGLKLYFPAVQVSRSLKAHGPMPQRSRCYLHCDTGVHRNLGKLCIDKIHSCDAGIHPDHVAIPDLASSPPFAQPMVAAGEAQPVPLPW